VGPRASSTRGHSVTFAQIQYFQDAEIQIHLGFPDFPTLPDSPWARGGKGASAEARISQSLVMTLWRRHLSAEAEVPRATGS